MFSTLIEEHVLQFDASIGKTTLDSLTIGMVYVDCNLCWSALNRFLKQDTTPLPPIPESNFEWVELVGELTDPKADADFTILRYLQSPNYMLEENVSSRIITLNGVTKCVSYNLKKNASMRFPSYFSIADGCIHSVSKMFCMVKKK